MNLLDLIARAKSLYLTLTDPNAGYLSKVKAFGTFMIYLLPILDQFGVEGPTKQEVGASATTFEAAIKDLEASAAEGVGAGGALLKKLLALLATLLPLLI